MYKIFFIGMAVGFISSLLILFFVVNEIIKDFKDNEYQIGYRRGHIDGYKEAENHLINF